MRSIATPTIITNTAPAATARTKEPEFTSAENVVWMGRAQDRWATLTQQYRNNTALPKQILNTFVKAQGDIDADYWQAHVAAAEYFLGHDDMQQAMEELAGALKVNPQDIR